MASIRLLQRSAAAGLLCLPGRARALSLDETIDHAFRPIAKAMSDFVFYSVSVGESELQLIVLWLIIGALAFTLYFRFINVRGFMHAIRVTRGVYDDPDEPGEVSHFQALTTAVSGTVGVGNITHVAVAISSAGRVRRSG